MKILSEKISGIDKRSVPVFGVVVFSTFLLLLLYHKDVWRPIQYWLLLNGSILFIIPLLSLVFFTKEGRRNARILASIFIALIIAFLFVVPLFKPLLLRVKQLDFVLITAGVMLSMTVIVLFYGKVDVRKFGIQAGRVKFWVPITIIFFAFMIPLIYWVSFMPEFQKTYPMLRIAKTGISGFIIAELSFGIFFIFWEYFFRGYMLFVLEKRTGFLIANLLQAMAFAFMHLGKPELEVYSSLAGGLIIGWLCYRSRSFLPAFLIHWGIQTMMDLFAVIH